jgi:PAS domain S-box-containing protein
VAGNEEISKVILSGHFHLLRDQFSVKMAMKRKPDMRQRRWRVRAYLWMLAMAVALPLAGVLVYSIVSDARHDEEQTRKASLNLAQLVASQSQQFLLDAENVAARLAQRPAIKALDPARRDPALEHFVELHPMYANLVVCDASGRVLHTALTPAAGVNLETLRASWIADVVQNGRVTVGKPNLGQITKRWVCTLAYPIRNDTGQVQGALGMSIDLARLHTAVSPVSLPPDSTITIVDKDGLVLMRSPGSQLWLGKDARGIEVVDMALARGEGNAIADGHDGQRRIFGFTTIPKIGWRVYVGIPTEFAFASARENAWRAISIALSLLALVIALVLLLGRSIAEPMRQLFQAATAAAEGRVQTAVASGPAEIAAVAEEFNRMVNIRQQKEAEVQRLNQQLELRVRERTAELENTNSKLQREVTERKRAEEEARSNRQELQDFIDSMSTLNAKVAPDGKLLLVNKSAQQAFGLSPEQLMETNFLEGQWWAFDPEVQERVREAFQRACEGIPVQYDEKLFAFGRVIDISFSLVPMTGADGRVSYIVAEGRDITPMKQAKAALAQRSEQLEATNKELEGFSYSVSHDLRAPLRSIDGFTRALSEECGAKLGEPGREYLQRVRGAALRMSQLMDDLLKLSRISRSDIRHNTVDLSAAAGDIARELRVADPDRAVDVVIQPGLIARGSPELLRLVLQNLLNNGWKFTRERTPGRIEFGAKPLNGQTVYFVRDNGAGFDMRYVKKLFGAFQRLHTAQQYEGTGIGLATVQRIVHRHGGRVWGEGELNQGAVFYFTLPGTEPTNTARSSNGH